jgi:hypothetical protein
MLWRIDSVRTQSSFFVLIVWTIGQMILFLHQVLEKIVEVFCPGRASRLLPMITVSSSATYSLCHVLFILILKDKTVGLHDTQMVYDTGMFLKFGTEQLCDFVIEVFIIVVYPLFQYTACDLILIIVESP